MPSGFIIIFRRHLNYWNGFIASTCTSATMENEQTAFLGYLPRQMSYYCLGLRIHWQDGNGILILRVVSLKLRGEIVTKVRVPHRHGSPSQHTSTSAHLRTLSINSRALATNKNLTCAEYNVSGCVLIVHIKRRLNISALWPSGNYLRCNKKHLPVLELFGGGHLY